MGRPKWTQEKIQENQHIEERRLEFLFEMYNKGVALDRKRYQFLVDHKYIKPDTGTYEFSTARPHTLNRKLYKDFEVKAEAEIAADEHVDVVSIDEDLSVAETKVVTQEAGYRPVALPGGPRRRKGQVRAEQTTGRRPDQDGL